MNHLGTATLHTNRLILRKFEVADAPSMFNNWASDNEVIKYLMWPAHETVDISKGYIESLIVRYKQPNTYDWGIELKGLGQVIGSIGVVRCNDDVGYVHIGYCIGRKWWNKGITSEAFAAVIKFLMDEVKVNRIESRHDPRNPYSGKVMEKCGLRYEGTLKESDINNQGICDAAWYALLRKEY
jgi:[ribosomal protein S5]-alanine N-acetyltransferase